MKQNWINGIHGKSGLGDSVEVALKQSGVHNALRLLCPFLPLHDETDSDLVYLPEDVITQDKAPTPDAIGAIQEAFLELLSELVCEPLNRGSGRQ